MSIVNENVIDASLAEQPPGRTLNAITIATSKIFADSQLNTRITRLCYVTGAVPVAGDAVELLVGCTWPIENHNGDIKNVAEDFRKEVLAQQVILQQTVAGEKRKYAEVNEELIGGCFVTDPARMSKIMSAA